MSENYNGWSNYATWRVKLEIFDGKDFSQDVSDGINYDSISSFADDLKEQAIEIVEMTGNSSGLMHDYAIVFLSDVNWYEIAESIASDYPELIKKD